MREVYIFLPDQNTFYIFLLSLLRNYNGRSPAVIVHLFRKTGSIFFAGLCVIGGSESYYQSQKSIERLLKECVPFSSLAADSSSSFKLNALSCDRI